MFANHPKNYQDDKYFLMVTLTTTTTTRKHDKCILNPQHCVVNKATLNE